MQKEAAGVEYTCPMHPQVRQIGPGSCPICGMALEPVHITRESADEVNPEYIDMLRRFWLSVPPSAVLLVLMFVGLHWPWLELVLASPVVLWAGWPIFERAWASIVHRSLNMFTLIGMGAGTAYLYSLVAMLLPGRHLALYFEPAAVIVCLVLLGQVLELRARSQTSSAIKALLKLAPDTARRIQPDGTEEDVALDHVHPGDLLRVRPGERVPVDGVVVEGASFVDEVDDHGRAGSRGKSAGQPRDRRDGQRHGRVRYESRARGRGHAAGAHRPDGEPRAALACTHSAAGGSRIGRVRAHGDRRRGGDVHHLGPGRSAAQVWLTRW